MKLSDACMIFAFSVSSMLSGVIFSTSFTDAIPYFWDWIYFQFLTVVVAYFYYNPVKLPHHLIKRVCHFCKALPRCWADSRTQTNSEMRLK